MPHEPVLGWDLGGAHIKAALVEQQGKVTAVVQTPCPLWMGLDKLEQGIETVLKGVAAAPGLMHAVTMTGELVDLFPDRASGVRELITVMRHHLSAGRLQIYGGSAGFLDPQSALSRTPEVASANWLASASLTAERIPEGLFVDVGSTTTDLIPITGSRVRASGYSDHQRLVREELLYTGVIRTPLMAVARRAPFSGEWVSLVAEQFATTADIYRLTGELPEDSDLLPSADNGEKTAIGSARRLARMLGLDADAAGMETWQGVSRFLSEQQLRALADACERLLSGSGLSASAPLVGAGTGRFLVKRLSDRLGRPYLDFSEFFSCTEQLKAKVAECAPAVAVASLAIGAA